MSAAAKAGRYSRQFGWPVLMLYLMAPAAAAQNLRGTIVYYVAFSIPVILCGIVLRLWTKGFYSSDGFIVDGAYRYVRNPVELGAVLVYVGGGVLMGLSWWWITLVAALSVAYLQFLSLNYEKQLGVRFGPAYLRYARRVRRWIPVSLPGANRSNRTYSLLHALDLEKSAGLWLLGYGLVFALRQHLRG